MSVSPAREGGRDQGSGADSAENINIRSNKITYPSSTSFCQKYIDNKIYQYHISLYFDIDI